MKGKSFKRFGMNILKRVTSSVLVAVMLFTMVGIYIPAETFKAAETGTGVYTTGSFYVVLDDCNIQADWGEKPTGGEMAGLGNGWYHKTVTFTETTENKTVQFKVTKDGAWYGDNGNNISATIEKGSTSFTVLFDANAGKIYYGSDAESKMSGLYAAVAGTFGDLNSSITWEPGDASNRMDYLGDGYYYKAVPLSGASGTVQYKIAYHGQWGGQINNGNDGNISLTITSGMKEIGFLVNANNNTVQNTKTNATAIASKLKELGKVSLDSESLYIEAGKTGTISATTFPAGIGLTYTSENEDIATVDANGVVTAVAKGETVIKVKISDTNFAECHVVVSEEKIVETIELDKTTLDMTEDDTAILIPTVSPEGIAVTWTSSDESVAKVDRGTVSAVGGGTATITATTPSGVEATCTVNVTEKPEYTYTIYVYSPTSSHFSTSNSALYIWDLESPEKLEKEENHPFDGTETIDGTTWLKTTITTKSKNFGMIFKSKGSWTWQTVNIEHENKASANQTLYIVEATSKNDEGKFNANIYTSLPGVKSPVVDGNKVTFYYNNPEGWTSGLTVKGTFNGWGDAVMTKKGNVFTYTTTLAPGVYGYKFHYTPNGNDGWFMDPLNSATIEEADGTVNSKLIVSGFKGATQEVQKGITTELPTKLDYIDASGNNKTGISVSYTLSEADIEAGVTIDGNDLFVPESYLANDLYLTVKGTVNNKEVSSTFDASLYTKKYTYTIYARSAIAARNSINNAAIWLWDSANETILESALYNFTSTEVLADGKTWMKMEVELTASKELGLILKNNHKTDWIWQTADLTFSNSAKTDQTIYIVDGYSTVYTDITKVPEEKYVYIEYEREDGSYSNTYAYAWNNGYTQKNGDVEEGLLFPFENVNGQYIAKIPVATGDSDKTIGFIAKKGTGWDAKDGGDNFVKIDADADFAKVRFKKGAITKVLSSEEGVKIDRKNETITFYFRDKELFEANNLDSLSGKVYMYYVAETTGVASELISEEMIYDEENERFYCQINLMEDTDYYYYYLVDGERVLDSNNYKTGTFQDEKYSLVRNKVYKVKLTATLLNGSMDYNDNNVIYLKWEPATADETLYGFNPEHIYVDLSELGLSSNAEMNLDLLKFAFGCAEGVEAGQKEITVKLVDDCDMTYYTTVKVNVTERTKTENTTTKLGEFDWDEAVIYFAVTDRFFDGNETNNTVTGGYNPDGPSSIHGGDFAGLTQKIQYLYDLGVNTIWLTPIVDNVDGNVRNEADGIESYGYHGYWASSFTDLNPHLGTPAELTALIEAAHAKGMKVMVDVVLNHAGYGAEDNFDDIIPVEGAVDGGGNQVYKDMIRENSINGDEEKKSLDGLPDFLTEDEEVRNKLIEWQTAWLDQFDIDYYRVDTVKHVDNTTWEAFKIALIEKDPEFKLIGEYFDAGYRNDYDQLDSGKMDSILDFHFNDILGSLITQDFAAIESALQNRNTLLTNTATMGSFLSSHDEVGFLYDMINNRGQDEDWAKALMKVAATYQITAKGQPVIYYGEEIGMTGDNNYPYQTNRYDFNWNLVNNSNTMYTHYQKMLNIRREYSEVFSKGERYSVVLPNVQKYDGTVVSQGYEVFARSYGKTTLYVGTNLWADNISASFYVDGGAGSVYKDLYSGETYTASSAGLITVDIPSADNGGTVVLVKTSGSTVSATDNNKVTVKIHYNRPNEDYEGWNAWLWSDTTGGKQYDFVEENGDMVATITVEGRRTNNVNFRIRFGDWKDNDHNAKDQSINISDVVSGTVHYYVESGVWGGIKVLGADAIVGNKIVTSSYDRTTNTFEIVTTRPIAGNIQSAFKIECITEDEFLTITKVSENGCKYTVSLEEDISGMRDVLKSYVVTFDGYEYSLIMPNIYSTKEFEDAYTYDGEDLGLTYSEVKSTFKVWAPTADKMVLNIYTSGTEGTEDLIKSYDMVYGSKGVWTYELEGDWSGKYYTYTVSVNNETNEVCDPYARTTGVNGARAMILDLDDTDPEGWAEDAKKNVHKGMSYTDAIIYELHVRDLSSDPSSGIANKGKFLGLTETGTTTSQGTPTGLDHIVDLGVTHVHLLPIYDYASVDESKLDETKYDPQFNWGYDPLNYNVPEGSYSTNPYDGASRVNEMKQMVKALHDNNINVIMDVVYNHVYDAGTFGFNQLVPSYFSRTNADGSFSNGSGCGNDTATERAMVHKYVVESILYWHEEYHIDGFRFDLVGLLDTVTINKIVDEVHAIDPDIIFYGEGWTLGTAVSKDGYLMATQANAKETPNFAYFSDTLRNGVAGDNVKGDGFISVSGKEDLMKQCFTATTGWCPKPTQTINYVSCHDNYTLMDKINEITNASYDSYDDAPGSYQVRLNNLSAAFYMFAQGIPFIHAGEEFLRTKLDEDGTIIHNSYNASDYVNTLRWYNLDADPLYADTVEYYKGLIEFRKNHEALRLTTSAQVASNVAYKWIKNDVIMFVIKGKASVPGETSDGIVIIYNGSSSNATVNLYNYGAAQGTWKVCVNEESAGTDVIKTVTNGQVTVASKSCMALVMGNTVDTESVYLNNYYESVTVDETLELEIGETSQLTATVTPTNVDVTWNSSNTAVATVDANGNVVAVAAGTTTITATTPNGTKATCTVIVTAEQVEPENPPVIPQTVTLDKTTLSIEEEGTATLVATTTPEGTTVTWSTNNAAAVTVDANGKVTAVAPGTAIITATTPDGATATCTVTVTAKPVEPEDPVDPPVEPENPVDPPVEPEDPVDPPAEPEDPVDPPVEPEDPVDPPVEPEDPEDPPVEPENPEDPPVEPEDPEDPPMEPEDPVDPPVEPEDPSVEPEDPVDPPVEPENPVTPDDTEEEEVVYVPETDVEEQVSGETDKLLDKITGSEPADNLVSEGIVSEETLEKVQNAIADNKTIITELVIENVKVTDVIEEAKELVEEAVQNIKENVESVIAQYLDIKVVLKEEESKEELGTLNKLSEEIILTFNIPDKWKKAGRIFNVIRVHEGATDVLDVWENEDGSLSFKTDRFSTYALVYTDMEAEEDGPGNEGGGTTPDNPTQPNQPSNPSGPTQPNQPSNPSNPTQPTLPPETGDDSAVGVYLVVLLMGCVAVITGLTKKKYVK